MSVAYMRVRPDALRDREGRWFKSSLSAEAWLPPILCSRPVRCFRLIQLLFAPESPPC